MSKRSEQLRFALEPPYALGIARECLGQYFQRHVAPELGVPCAPIAPITSYDPSFVPVARLILIGSLLVDVFNHTDVLLQDLVRLKRQVASVGRCVKLDSGGRMFVVNAVENRDD